MDNRYMGAQIRRCRMKQGYTQERLAERVGVSTSFIGHVERGTRKASVATIEKISRALGEPIDALVRPAFDEKEERAYTREQLRKARKLLEVALSLCSSADEEDG